MGRTLEIGALSKLSPLLEGEALAFPLVTLGAAFLLVLPEALVCVVFLDSVPRPEEINPPKPRPSRMEFFAMGSVVLRNEDFSSDLQTGILDDIVSGLDPRNG